MIWLSQEDVVRSGIMDMSLAQRQVEETFRLYHKGDALAAQEIPIHLTQKEWNGSFYSLPAFIGGEAPAVALKWTTHFRDNEKKGKPRIHTLLVLSCPQSGEPLAVMEGSVISAMRTGAVSATAFKYLAKPESTSVFCCGSGVQARQQIRAACFALPAVNQVWIWGRNREKIQCLVGEMAQEYPGICFSAADSLQGAADCNIVIGATAAEEPYLEQDHFKEDGFYCHIGFHEISAAAISSFDHIVCDDFHKGVPHSGQSLFRANREGVLEPRLLAGNLSDYVVGEKVLPRQGRGRIMFDAFGLPVFDAVLGRWVYRYAVEHGLGIELPL